MLKPAWRLLLAFSPGYQSAASCAWFALEMICQLACCVTGAQLILPGCHILEYIIGDVIIGDAIMIMIMAECRPKTPLQTSPLASTSTFPTTTRPTPPSAASPPRIGTSMHPAAHSRRPASGELTSLHKPLTVSFARLAYMANQSMCTKYLLGLQRRQVATAGSCTLCAQWRAAIYVTEVSMRGTPMRANDL